MIYLQGNFTVFLYRYTDTKTLPHQKCRHYTR